MSNSETQSIGSKSGRREQLLYTALAIFAEKGYHATTVGDIIERASVARGTFYNYFDSKRQIFECVLDQLFTLATQAVFPISIGPAAEMRAGVRGNIKALCTSLMENLPVARLLLEQAVGLDSEANEQLKNFYDRILTRLELAIRDGQSMGIVRAGNASIIATSLLGLIKEALFQQLIGTRRHSVAELVEELFTIADRGILEG